MIPVSCMIVAILFGPVTGLFIGFFLGRAYENYEICKEELKK